MSFMSSLYQFPPDAPFVREAFEEYRSELLRSFAAEASRRLDDLEATDPDNVIEKGRKLRIYYQSYEQLEAVDRELRRNYQKSLAI